MLNVLLVIFHLNRSDGECGHQPEGAAGHAGEVDEEVCQVTRQETVDPATGSH